MAFSFKSALNNVVSAAKKAVSAVSTAIAPKKPTTVVKPPSSNFINNTLKPTQKLTTPISKPTYNSTPTVLPNYVLSSVQNPITNNKSNPLSVNKSTTQSPQPSNTNNNWLKSVGSSFQGAGNWIDQNVREGSGNAVGETINKIGTLAGQFKNGGTAFSSGIGVKPTFDFSAALQGLGNKLVKKASASEYGTGNGSNTPTGSYIVDKNSSTPDGSFNRDKVLGDKTTAPYAVGSLPDGRVKMSDGTIRANDNSIFDNAKKNYDQFSTDKTPQLDNGQDAYVALNDEVNNIISEYENGNMSSEDAQNRMAEAQRSYLWAQYNTNKTEGESLIPQYEQFRDKAIGDVDTNLSEVKTNAVRTKETNTNTYGDLLRRSAANKRYTDAQRRNQFSALGTADSSSFIENQTRADSDFGSDQNVTERQLAGKNSDIDTEVTKAEKLAMDQKNSLVTDAQTKIEAVRRSTKLSREEVEAKIETINAQLYNDVVGLAQDLSDKKANLLTTQLSLAGNLQAIKEQGNVDLNTQQQAYKLQNQSNQLPADVQTELSGYSAKPSSSYAKKLRQQQLMAEYPAWATYIQQIMGQA